MDAAVHLAAVSKRSHRIALISLFLDALLNLMGNSGSIVHYFECVSL